MCLVCGLENPAGLKAAFYELDNAEVAALFRPMDVHQGYPDVMHGGMVTAILDETIGRAVSIGSKADVWWVTAEITIRFKKPVPLNTDLKVTARITENGSRLFQGTGEIRLPDGTVAAEGTGKYLFVPLEKIMQVHPEHLDWRVTVMENDPSIIEF